MEIVRNPGGSLREWSRNTKLSLAGVKYAFDKLKKKLLLRIYSRINFGALKLKGNPTVIIDQKPLPQSFLLLQNWPNPFNSSTQITFVLKNQANVALEVFDLNGRRMAVLINQQLSAGRHNVRLNASQWASGLYFYRLRLNGALTGQVRRMLLLK